MGLKQYLSKHKVLAGAMIILVIIIGLLAVKAAALKKPPVPVLPPVKAGNEVNATGVVVPVHYAALGLNVNGIVGRVAVAEGDQVVAGQLLLRLQNQDIQAGVQSAQAALEKAQTNLVSVREKSGDIAGSDASVKAAATALDAAKADYDRTKFLFDQGAVSAQQLEQAKTAYSSAESNLQKAQASLAAANADVSAAAASLQQAEASLAQTELRAPFAGTVTMIAPHVGESVVADTPVVQLGDLSEWRIETDDLTELQVVNIQPGDPAMLTFDAIPDLQLPGTVVSIRTFGEKKKGDMTYTVVIKPDHLDNRLRWNMTATVAIKPSSIK